MEQDFQPQYIGGYPTEETAAAMFEEYDYQAATQFYLLMGENSYRLRVPPDVPVAQFWQIPVHDVERRAMISTDQNRPTLAGTDGLITNADGSIDIYFGPEAPDGYERNWIKTTPGEGWFTLPRLFGPLEPVLDKTWRWNDVELLD